MCGQRARRFDHFGAPDKDPSAASTKEPPITLLQKCRRFKIDDKTILSNKINGFAGMGRSPVIITLDYMLVSTTTSIIMWPTIDSTLICCKRLKLETLCLEQFIYDICN